jgi:hypothetical protein
MQTAEIHYERHNYSKLITLPYFFYVLLSTERTFAARLRLCGGKSPLRHWQWDSQFHLYGNTDTLPQEMLGLGVIQKL